MSLSKAPDRIAVAISHSTCAALSPSDSLILGASTPSISQTLNRSVNATVDSVITIHLALGCAGADLEFIESLSWRQKVESREPESKSAALTEIGRGLR